MFLRKKNKERLDNEGAAPKIDGGEDEHSANVALLTHFPIDFARCLLYARV